MKNKKHFYIFGSDYTVLEDQGSRYILVNKYGNKVNILKKYVERMIYNGE